MLSCLPKWSRLGRILACTLTSSDMSCVLVSVYGFPRSHTGRHANEILLAELLFWAGGLMFPVLIGGDLNETVSSCSVLSLLQQWQFFSYFPRPTHDKRQTGVCGQI